MEKSLRKLNQRERHKLWSERVAACRSSGISVRQWCRENGISEKTYYYWQHRLFESARAVSDMPEFAEVIIPDAHSTGVAAVVCTDAFRLEIQNGADASTLQAVFHALLSC